MDKEATSLVTAAKEISPASVQADIENLRMQLIDECKRVEQEVSDLQSRLAYREATERALNAAISSLDSFLQEGTPSR